MLALNLKLTDMGKNRKKVKHSRAEEKQAQKVLKVVCISMLALALIMLIAYSFLGN